MRIVHFLLPSIAQFLDKLCSSSVDNCAGWYLLIRGIRIYNNYTMPSLARRPAGKGKALTATLRPSKPAVVVLPVKSRYDLQFYPWDDYQDQIVVNSVEVEQKPFKTDKPLVGVEHYLHLLSHKPDYTHICIHPDEHRQSASHARFDSSSSDGDLSINPSIPYDHLPTPKAGYSLPVYQSHTTNPAVFLAIIRLAQRNIPSIDFTSALQHVPNMPAKKTASQLVYPGFADDYFHLPHWTDVRYTLAFLPHFYADERHAVGFYLPGRAHQPPDACFFAACSSEDLEEFGLVEYLVDEVNGALSMGAVGSREGVWLHIAEHEEWARVDVVAKTVWQKRLGACDPGEDGLFGKE
jgi:hypothetical protein